MAWPWAIAVVFGAQEAPISDVFWVGGGNPSSNPEKSNKWYFFLLEGEGEGRKKKIKNKGGWNQWSRDTTDRRILYIRVTQGSRVTLGQPGNDVPRVT